MVQGTQEGDSGGGSSGGEGRRDASRGAGGTGVAGATALLRSTYCSPVMMRVLGMRLAGLGPRARELARAALQLAQHSCWKLSVATKDAAK